MKVLLSLEGFTSEVEQRKLYLAAKLMESAFNSDQFKNWVLNYSYKYQKQIGGIWPFRKYSYQESFSFYMDNNLTREEIYTTIMSGKERGSIIDNEANIFLKIDRSVHRGVIGYTYPNTKWQYVYSWFIDSSSSQQIAGNLAHEYCHKLGFDHPFKSTSLRPFSVPYAVGHYVSTQFKEK